MCVCVYIYIYIYIYMNYFLLHVYFLIIVFNRIVSHDCMYIKHMRTILIDRALYKCLYIIIIICKHHFYPAALFAACRLCNASRTGLSLGRRQART